ncbi:cobalt-precorrin-5B (C(1))-methyltransferase CbiD [Aliinostoc sp. HNIBRCY26]|uniref:cobalt-precorrin-5B (C(1))-methyltransferase CbiD n=1 Tax=Aliinostoc sp. HNIBRCY26 TaxID=3418997 RepID=UPI003D086B78
MTRSGYTLPVFACAAAVAALRWLRERQPLVVVAVDLITPAQIAEIPIEQVTGLSEQMALAITRSDPGDNLDLTKDTPVWALVEWGGVGDEQVTIRGGEGIGKQVNAENHPAIYGYARQLMQENLSRLLAPTEKITATIILPEGRSLALRTSNAAFGVVEGLSLLGTSGISQPLSTPEQLESFRATLQQKASQFSSLVFCIGENGLDLAAKTGINPDKLVKTANWLGAMLVEAELLGVKEILLFGYHGKLLKLAGGIFHTHHHLADGRREVLTSHCALAGLDQQNLEVVFHSPTAEAALTHLRGLDQATDSDWVNQVYSAIANTIDARCQEYLQSHRTDNTQNTICGSILFDRSRKIIIKSKTACNLIGNLC